ncbi:MAG: geranylgeranyl reductase family protein [Gaiellaceae bacterium]
MKDVDVAVVGAGPAGSVCAYRLARAGASVMLLDRASFPRDKPCGGGLTGRAMRELPIDVDEVVEARVDEFEFRLRYGATYLRKSRQPLVVMTQRARLDAHLAEAASAAGADFRDATKVDHIQCESDGSFNLSCDGERVGARVVIAADGANGKAASQLGLSGQRTLGVALEGNIPLGKIDGARYQDRAVLELATLPGGYGWVFPKADHLNLGVGGWESTGPTLRDHLERLCEAHGTNVEALENVRGHRLPLRRRGAPLARGRAALVGDAAGLVDPVSGDGMFECFVSARLCSAAALEVLSGKQSDLAPYAAALEGRLGRLSSASWKAKHAFDRFPRTAFALTRPPFVWPIIEQLIHGEIDDPGASKGPGRVALKALKAVASLTPRGKAAGSART